MSRMPNKATESRQESLTAFYLHQLSLGSFLKPVERMTHAAHAEARAKRIEAIRAILKESQMATIMELALELDETRECIRSTIAAMEKSGIVRRVNSNGRLNWVLS